MAHASVSADHGHHDDEQHIAHVTPIKVYFAVWAALIVGTVITVAVSYVDFNVILGVPNVNLFVAMIVAITKALLVCAFFMHLKYDNKIFAVTFASAAIFLAIFFLLTFSDLMTRGQVDDKQGTFVKDHRAQQQVAPSATPQRSAH
ncbi:MAG: cytochrome C oxidase subunit IV family protein [Deltaproteobacteria bacterium]|nr:cytochrome C oxidase subunit IV family protein [Deltaproteobacteria bacterium]